MAAKCKTILSAGEIIRAVLLSDPGVKAITGKVYPVATAEARLPYIVYRRLSLEAVAPKGCRPAAAADIEVLCFASGYAASVELAEAVREALDGAVAATGDMAMRSCVLSDSEETWQDDAYVQRLVFTVKI